MRAMQDINWLKSTTEDRKILYRFAKHIRDYERWSFDRFLREALGSDEKVGLGYEDNFRSGRISRKKANLIYRWMCQNRPDQAHQLSLEIHAARMRGTEPPDTSWDGLIRKYGRFSNLEIVSVRMSPIGLVDIADAEPISDRPLRLGEEFCFRLEVSFAGQVLAFQHHGDQWYPLPLSKSGLHCAAQTGVQILPNDPETGAPVPLSEQTDIGLHGFAFVLRRDARISDVSADLKKGLALANSVEEELVRLLFGKDEEPSTVFRINVMVLT